MTDRQKNGARELHEHRDDPEEWSDEPDPIDVRPTRSEVVSFRLPSDELDALEDSARKAGESLSEYVRNALAIRMHGTPIGPAVEISSGGGHVMVRSHIVTGRRSTAPMSMVPDLPPTMVTIGRS